MKNIKNILKNLDLPQKHFLLLLSIFIFVGFPFSLINLSHWQALQQRKGEIQNLEFKINKYTNRSNSNFTPLINKHDINRDISEIKSLLEKNSLAFIKSDTSSQQDKDTINYQINGSYLNFLAL